FFFQAEDGIRDFHVTGVQTCALPIFADGVFTAHAERSDRSSGTRDPFTIVMPPPNVTGVLHMGHGLNNTVQDVLVRWRRMAGDRSEERRVGKGWRVDWAECRGRKEER